MSEGYFACTEMMTTDFFMKNPCNPNKHPESQIISLAKIIRHQG